MSAAPAARTAQRILGAADRLVGGQQHSRLPAQLGQLGQRRAGLLGVLQAEPVQLGQHAGGVRHVPAPVDVDPDPAAGAERVPHRFHPVDVVGAGLARSATLTLAVRQPEAATMRCACSGPTAGTVTLTGTWSRRRRGPAVPGRLQRAGQPAGALPRPVLGERGELAPSGRALDQRALADRDAAELGAHRDRRTRAATPAARPPGPQRRALRPLPVRRLICPDNLTS